MSSFDRNALRSKDCVVILTDHSNVDYRKIAKESKLIVDTRNATKGIPNRKKVVKL